MRALLQGVVDVLRAPLLLVGIALITLAIALPFAAVLQSRLQESLSVQPHVNLDDAEIDPEWWMEFREQARGLEATFTPAVLGFAATLDGLSNVLDGNRVPAAIFLPLALSMAAWAFIWGAVLQRFRAGHGLGIGGSFRAGASHFVPFVAIALVAAIVNLVLYFTVHKLLFGPVYQSLSGLTSSERDAFFIRVALYLVFVVLIATVSLVAGYARIAAVSGRDRSPAALLRSSWSFIRGNTGAVATLFVLTGALFVAVTTAYGFLEVVGGSQVGGWRAIAIGQAYVFARLGIRLLFAASELRLFTMNQAAAAE